MQAIYSTIHKTKEKVKMLKKSILLITGGIVITYAIVQLVKKM